METRKFIFDNLSTVNLNIPLIRSSAIEVLNEHINDRWHFNYQTKELRVQSEACTATINQYKDLSVNKNQRLMLLRNTNTKYKNLRNLKKTYNLFISNHKQLLSEYRKNISDIKIIQSADYYLMLNLDISTSITLIDQLTKLLPHIKDPIIEKYIEATHSLTNNKKQAAFNIFSHEIPDLEKINGTGSTYTITCVVSEINTPHIDVRTSTYLIKTNGAILDVFTTNTPETKVNIEDGLFELHNELNEVSKKFILYQHAAGRFNQGRKTPEYGGKYMLYNDQFMVYPLELPDGTWYFTIK